MEGYEKDLTFDDVAIFGLTAVTTDANATGGRYRVMIVVATKSNA